MAVNQRVRWVLFVGPLVGLALFAFLRSGPGAIPVVHLTGPEEAALSLADLRTMPYVEREGSFQNQYGNWSAPARYRGVPVLALADELRSGFRPMEVVVVAEDGYRVVFPLHRLTDSDYPVVLAYAKDGLMPPQWEQGLQIAVLPDGGRVSNEAYGVASAGAYWVQNVTRMEFVPSSAP